MRNLTFLSAILAAFACSSMAQDKAIEPSRILVYKGTIKASKTLFDVNDTNNLISASIKGYWVMTTSLAPPPLLGYVNGSKSVIYDARDKCYKAMIYEIQTEIYDPNRVVMYHFEESFIEGDLWFDVVGKGKKESGNGSVDIYTPRTLKGTGFASNIRFLDSEISYTGPVEVSMTLCRKWMIYYGESVTVNAIRFEMFSRGWTELPDSAPVPVIPDDMPILDPPEP